ncbi:ABC transporter substrate-binding protein [Jiella sonneratiae]|uniref:Extracellular solute-binding protein n=1 Tax=Jiella sonneratiae TaxID=2816856 RepID=A0ABS3IZK0_9HYPH|nr:extracellular solute-binding protein [Jiella sonneratiae]MBO0902829.1 extracellular solute-binding protein [Jiella sonneratiae]
MNEASRIRGRTAGRTVAAPAVHARGKVLLRVLGTEITLLEQLRRRAEADLGIRLAFDNLDFLGAQSKAARSPEAYDVYDQCFHNLDIVWYWRAIQAIDTDRIPLFDEVSSLTRTGTIGPSGHIGHGDVPVAKLFVQPDQSLSANPSRLISMLPTVHNFDSFGYVEDAAGVSASRVSSWAALLDPALHGRVSFVDEPAIGIFDVALAAQSAKLMQFQNIGNLSVDEIDALVRILVEKKREGHFAGFWKTAAEATAMMASGRFCVGSLWSPSVIALKRRGVHVRQAVPVEGYRAWHGGLCLSSRLGGRELDAAYDYLNWWLSGWPGAVVARQGYYMSVVDRVRDNLTEAEWAYWYDGRPAATDLPDPDGETAIAKGSLRSGGSYWSRASNIAVWNTTMDEHNYLVRRWGELVG